MDKSYTLRYVVNDFEKCEQDFVNYKDFIFNSQEKYKIVFDALDKIKLKPRKNLIDKILKSAGLKV